MRETRRLDTDGDGTSGVWEFEHLQISFLGPIVSASSCTSTQMPMITFWRGWLSKGMLVIRYIRNQHIIDILDSILKQTLVISTPGGAVAAGMTLLTRRSLSSTFEYSSWLMQAAKECFLSCKSTTLTINRYLLLWDRPFWSDLIRRVRYHCFLVILPWKQNLCISRRVTIRYISGPDIRFSLVNHMPGHTKKGLHHPIKLSDQCI